MITFIFEHSIPVVEKDGIKFVPIPIKWSFYFDKYVKRYKLSSEKRASLLTVITEDARLAINLLTMEIAKYMDSKYPNHITEVKDLYIISAVSLETLRWDGTFFSPYISYFRDECSAELAKKILAPFLLKLYE